MRIWAGALAHRLEVTTLVDTMYDGDKNLFNVNVYNGISNLI